MPRGFRGESTHKVDQKGRVSVPAPFRRVLEEGDPDWLPGQNPTMVLIYGFPGRPRLEAYSMEGAGKIDEMIEAMPRFSKKRQIAERFFNAKSMYLQVDENGRLVLPAKLREKIGLVSEASFVGMGEHFQIWAPDEFGADDNELTDVLESMGEDTSAEENLFAMFDDADGGGVQ